MPRGCLALHRPIVLDRETGRIEGTQVLSFGPHFCQFREPWQNESHDHGNLRGLGAGPIMVSQG